MKIQVVSGFLITLLVTTHLICCHGNTTSPNQAQSIRIPSVVYNCSADYIQHMTNLMSSHGQVLFVSQNQTVSTIMSFIGVLCSPDYQYGTSFLTCLNKSLPGSSFLIDHILLFAINQSSLTDILVSGCSLMPALFSRLNCIIEQLVSSPVSLDAIMAVQSYFTNLLASESGVDAFEFCRTWGSMVRIVAPFLAVCDPSLSQYWSLHGQNVLNDKCKTAAFEKSSTIHQLGEAQSVFSDLFLGNQSAIRTCTDDAQLSLVPFLPPTFFQHSQDPSQLVIAFMKTCRSDVQSFMFCLDEQRLNISTDTDHFIFQVISTVNIRIAYKKLCSQIDVLQQNINCLLNTVLELTSCQCYLTEMIQILTTSRNKSNIAEEFCVLYSSYIHCYASLLGHCDLDIALLLEDVYIGSLTGVCQSSKSAECSTLGQKQLSRMSGVLQCGEPLTGYMSTIFKGQSTKTWRLSDLMEHVEEHIMTLYEFTCSIGEDLLQCIQGVFLTSHHPLDLVLEAMFDRSQLASVLEKGCRPALIQEVKQKIHYLMTLMLSDPRMSDCQRKIEQFTTNLTDQVDVYEGDTLQLYCSIWAEFSQCVESKLACTGTSLAKTWHNLTIDILTQPCFNAISHQRGIIGVPCDMHHVTDSASVMCGISHMSQFQDIQQAGQNVSDMAVNIRRFIHHSCYNKQKVVMKTVACLQRMVPSSLMSLDRVVLNVFNFTQLRMVVDSACNQTSELVDILPCLVKRMKIGHVTKTCIHEGLVPSFSLTYDAKFNITEQISTACRGWYQFIVCMKPHIESCDASLGWLWKRLGTMVLSQSCQHDLDLQGSRSHSSAEGHRSAESMGLVWLCFIISNLIHLLIFAF